MKKLIYLIVAIAFLGLIVPGCLPVVPPTEQSESVTLPNRNPDINVPADYDTIQEAIDAATIPGEIIMVAAGNYPEQLNINKSLSIIGVSRDSVTIDASSFSSGYGISVTADNVALEKFTLKGPNHESGYGIHTSGCDTVNFESLLVENSGRSGVDLIGCSNITINNVEAKNNGKKGIGGVGIAITDSNIVAVSNITTSGNTWAGMAVFTYGQYPTYPGGCDDIALTGANYSSLEPGPFYTETGRYGGGATDPDYPITNLKVSDDFKYILRFPLSGPHKTAFFRTLDDALYAGAAAIILYGALAADVVVNDVITETPLVDYGTYYVGPGMIIQSAINAASSGNAIFVSAGMYTEAVTINKSLTLMSDTGDYRTTGTILTGAFDLDLKADGITVKGFKFYNVTDKGAIELWDKDNITITWNSFKDCYGPAIGVWGEGGEVNNLVIEYNKIENITGYNHSGIQVMNDLINSVISNNEITKTVYAGMILEELQNVTVSNNTISNTPRKGIQVAHSPNCNVTIRDNYIINTNTLHDADEGAITIYPDVTNILIEGNTLTGNYQGFTVRDKSGAVAVDVYVNFNKIYGNDGFGVGNFAQGGGTLNATCNWWGDASGPYHMTNPSGTGDEVSNNVNFDPWLGKELCALKIAIAALTINDFTKPKAWVDQKQALLDKIDDVCQQIDNGAYLGAINKLQHDVVKKLEKWIVESGELIGMVNAEIVILENFL